MSWSGRPEVEGSSVPNSIAAIATIDEGGVGPLRQRSKEQKRGLVGKIAT